MQYESKLISLTNSIYSDGTECMAQKSYRKKDHRYDYICTNNRVYAKLHSLFEVCVDEIPTRFAYLINFNKKKINLIQIIYCKRIKRVLQPANDPNDFCGLLKGKKTNK